AGFIFFIGFVFAKIAKQLIQTALAAVDLTKLAAKFRSMGDKATGVVDDWMGGGRPQPDVAAQQAAQRQQGMPPQQAPNADAATNAKIANLIGNLVFRIIIIDVPSEALQVPWLDAI